MELYSIVNGKKYRKGYTTGSCAAAASKAAVMMLVSGTPLDSVEIDTPAGIRLKLILEDSVMDAWRAKCAVVKDGGDDPDMTHGLKVYAEARFIEKEDILIKAGEGIGVVTSPGLKVAVGQPAINPVPMQMIRKEVQEALPVGKGVEIVLSVPGGEKVAKNTYNPKLGIHGGISILGTKGIVEPMSEEAWKDSLALELSVMAAKGIRQTVFIFGNYGEDFVEKKLGIKQERIIKISNFVGYMLDKAVEQKVEKIVLVGHIGKLVKVAAGIFHTHSRVADARMETLAAYAALEGAGQKTIRKIYECRTTEAAAEIIHGNRLEGVYDRIVSNAADRCSNYTFGKITVGAVLFNANNAVLAMDKNAEDILNGVEKEKRSSHEQ